MSRLFIILNFTSFVNHVILWLALFCESCYSVNHTIPNNIILWIALLNIILHFSLSDDFSTVSKLQIIYMLSVDHFERSKRKFALKRFTEEEENIFPEIALHRLNLFNPLDCEEVDNPWKRCPTRANHEGFEMFTATELDDPVIRERLQVHYQVLIEVNS